MATPNKKSMGRVVFQGNRVVGQNYDAATVKDLGSQPATMEASKAADLHVCAPHLWLRVGRLQCDTIDPNPDE